MKTYHFDMRVLELFAGSRSIGNIADKLGYEVFSVDINQFDKIDLAIDILDLKKEMIPFEPDIIWASPPCTTYSVAAISHHRNYGIPKTEFAAISDKLIMKTLSLIKDFNPKFWYIENPRGYLRKMDFMKGLSRTTITYCSYGDSRMKPTDIWSNNIHNIFNPNGWKPRAMCFNGNKKCHHQPAPRGSKTGTQGLKNNYERSKIPEELCVEILTNNRKLSD
jgi:site-specific DNA-cytosine methylase